MNAPQVTPAMVEAAIASEHYFTGRDGVMWAGQHGAEVGQWPIDSNGPLYLVTFCALVLRNGHIVVGDSYCADPANFNAETGRKEARKVAINKLWPMVVYAERERLAATTTFLASLLASEVECGVFEEHVSPVLERHGLSGLPIPTEGLDTKVAWTVIDPSNPATLPPPGDWLVTVDADNGREVHVLWLDEDKQWWHAGEYVFEHAYYFRPIAWAPRPEAYSAPVPSEG